MSRTFNRLGFGLAVVLPLSILQEPEALEGLGPDEEAAFRRSVHNVIGCEGCHEPGQPTRVPRNVIPQTCGDPCHGEQLEEYAASVHWDDARPGAVCVDCHGVHDMAPVRMPESRAFRSLICGNCHIGPAENFERGPHKSGMEATGALACASCHSNHNVRRPTVALVEAACATCHPEPSEAFRMGQDVKLLFSGVRDALDRARVSIDRAGALNLDVKAPRRTIQKARSEFTQARLVWHSLQMDEIEASAGQSTFWTRKATDQVSGLLQDRRKRRLGLVLVWVIILLNVALLWARKRQVDRR